MNKTIVFGDIHFGEKSNSVTFNQDCLDYIDWMIDQAKKEGIKRCFFLGDWHHIRASLNVNTMNYSLKGIRKIAEYFDEVHMILGNHDLYYRESLSVHSLEFAKEFKNIKIYDKQTKVEDATFVPWILGNEWESVKKIDTPYVFGHFAIPGFYMNAQVQMQDNGEQLTEDSFHHNVLYVMSGHFHKRQIHYPKAGYEVHYIGNCFPHNFNDVNDVLRGCCIIEDGKPPRYLNWDKMPNYKSLRLSELLESPETYINTKTYAKVMLDLNISYEEANFIRDTFIKIFGTRELSFTYEKKETQDFSEIEDIKFESVDAIVLKCIENVESKTIDRRKLADLYNEL